MKNIRNTITSVNEVMNKREVVEGMLTTVTDLKVVAQELVNNVRELHKDALVINKELLVVAGKNQEVQTAIYEVLKVKETAMLDKNEMSLLMTIVVEKARLNLLERMIDLKDYDVTVFSEMLSNLTGIIMGRTKEVNSNTIEIIQESLKDLKDMRESYKEIENELDEQYNEIQSQIDLDTELLEEISKTIRSLYI